MSYCRMSEDSDVYMTDDFQNGVTCYSCKLTDEREIVVLGNPLRGFNHLHDHMDAGHKVPEHAVTRLWHEIKIEEIRAAHKTETDNLREIIEDLKRQTG